MDEDFLPRGPHNTIGQIGRRCPLSSQIAAVLVASYEHDLHIASMKDAGIPIVVSDSGRENVDFSSFVKDFERYRDPTDFSRLLPYSDSRFPELFDELGSKLSDYSCPVYSCPGLLNIDSNVPLYQQEQFKKDPIDFDWIKILIS